MNTNLQGDDEILFDICGDDNEVMQSMAVFMLQLNFGKWGPSGDPLESILFYGKDGVVSTEKQYNEVRECSDIIIAKYSMISAEGGAYCVTLAECCATMVFMTSYNPCRLRLVCSPSMVLLASIGLKCR